ncbi:hypothetical protein ACFYNM_34705 [Streptomyces spororaveus]|uniref:hypothetical protein n=1 Tax=Streptomyces spororaveus TaxID=284039 RepID=UPI0036C958F1
MFMVEGEEATVRAQRTLLSEVTAGLSDKYPDVHVTHEVLTGHPVEEPARAAEHALAVVVGPPWPRRLYRHAARIRRVTWP